MSAANPSLPIDPFYDPDAAPDVRLARLERALRGSRDGYWERNLRTGQSWYSDSFRSLFGFSPDELPNDRDAVNARIHRDDIAPFIAAYEQAIRDRSTFTYELRYLDKAGTWRWVRGRGRVWTGADGEPEFITGALVDVHQHVSARDALERERQALALQVSERTERLEQALAEAEQGRRDAELANAAKTRFLAHMSHEIRTPLNGVLGLAELALRAATAPSQRRHLDVALESGQALLRLVEDVLDMSRVEAGGLTLADEPFDLAELLAGAMRTLMPMAQSRGLEMRYDHVGPARVRGDAARLRQILTNLLGNALKFTPDGQIDMIATVREVDGRAAVTVTVQDTGPGLPPALVDRVFEPFEQGDSSLTRRHGGAGLGLAIARGLARVMGGDLTASNRDDGDGARFTLRLDLPLADPTPAPRVDGRLWLIAPAHRGWLPPRLERAGWHVSALPDADAALAALAPPGVERPDAVLLVPRAVEAPGALARLRAALPDCPMSIIVPADWNDTEREAEALAHGVTCRVRPLSPATIAALGERPRVATAVAASAAAAAADVLLVEDNPVNRLIAEQFLHALGVGVRSAENGELALTACRDRAPRLVLMDLQMPVLDGLEATRRLRAWQREGELPSFPIVALTAHALANDAKQCRDAGMDGYLTKPILLETLKRELAKWLPELA